MLEQSALQRYMAESYRRARRKNTAYSVRSFAKRLGMSSGAVSSILRGQRRVSRKLAGKILASLDADPRTHHEIMALFPVKKAPGTVRARTEMLLSLDQFELVSRSVHFELLCLLEIPGFREDPVWISGRLRRTTREVQEALERLLRLGMLKRVKGALSLTGESYVSPDGTADASIRQSHFESLDQARRSLELNSVAERDFSSETLALDPDLLPEAREILRDAIQKIAELSATGEPREVYKLSLQLFPLSQLGDRQ